MAKIIVQADTKQAEKKLQALIAATKDMTPAYKTVGSVVANRVRLCFKLSIDPWGKPWAPIKWRAPRRTNDGAKFSRAGRSQIQANTAGNAGQPLRDTGRLQRSFTSKADAQGVTVGTNVKHARVHQFGATIKPVKGKFLRFPGPGGALIFAKQSVIPQRAFLPIRSVGAPVVLPPAWSAAVVRALKRHFMKAVDEATA